MGEPPQPEMTTTPLSRRPLLRFLRKALGNWLERHQHPLNFWIHLVGIPVAVAGFGLIFILPWYWGVSGLVVGYLLQYIGHWVEGNDVGEWAAIKRLLGLPYVGIAPRWQQEPGNRAASATKS